MLRAHVKTTNQLRAHIVYNNLGQQNVSQKYYRDSSICNIHITDVCDKITIILLIGCLSKFAQSDWGLLSLPPIAL